MTRATLILIATLYSSGQAMAHGGHVGELAGHSHWLGLAAVAAAAALALWSRKRKGEKADEEAKDGEEAETAKS